MNSFKNFENTFYSHFNLRSNVETINSVADILSSYPRHIFIIKINKIVNDIYDKTLSQFDFLKKSELLTFDENSDISLQNSFKELKEKTSNSKLIQFFDFSITLSSSHKEFNKLIKEIQTISKMKNQTFSIINIEISDNINNPNTIRFLNDFLIPLKEDINDTLTFYLLQTDKELKLLYSLSSKSKSSHYENPQMKSILHYSLYRYDTGKVGWIFFFALFGLIIIFILFKIY